MHPWSEKLVLSDWFRDCARHLRPSFEGRRKRVKSEASVPNSSRFGLNECPVAAVLKDAPLESSEPFEIVNHWPHELYECWVWSDLLSNANNQRYLLVLRRSGEGQSKVQSTRLGGPWYGKGQNFDFPSNIAVSSSRLGSMWLACWQSDPAQRMPVSV